LKKIVVLVAGLFLLVVLLAGSVFTPYQGFAAPININVPRGTSTRALASLLAEKGVVRYDWQFLLARLFHPGSKLLAGEYQFRQAASASSVFARIVAGDIFYYEVTVPEGRNMFEIAKIVHENLPFIAEAAFLEAARDPEEIHDIDEGARSLEGYLFPSTYRVTSGTTAAELARQMVDQFRQVWAQVGANRAPGKVMALASLIEEEARLEKERALISSVFHNRLNRGMKLDCDPTVVYAALLENKYKGVIHQSDLQRDHAYNTYKNTGLPPGPISNPGMASIKAALQPANTTYLFFVASASGDGSHQFSGTMQEHTQAVGNYRKANGKETRARAVARRGKSK